MLVREEQGYKRLQVHPPLHMRGRRSPQRQGMQWWKLQEDRPRPPTQTPGTLKLWHILRYFCRSADSSHSNCGGPYNLSGHTEASTVSTGGPGGCAAPPGGQTHYSAMKKRASLGAQAVKDLPAMWETLGSIPGLRRSPGGGHGNPLQYSCLENPHGGLQSMRLQRVGRN